MTRKIDKLIEESLAVRQARHTELVEIVRVALLNISEAGESFKGDDPVRVKADYIVLCLQREGVQ